MDPFLTTILKKAPKALKLIPTSFLDESDIIDAIDAGYEITEDTPARLLKFSAIRKKFHEKYYDELKSGTLAIRVEELINILSDEDYFPYYAMDTILENIHQLSDKEKQQVLDVILQHADIIEPTKLPNFIYYHPEVAYKFLENHPNEFKNIVRIHKDKALVQASAKKNELDYEKIYEALKLHEDIFDFSTINQQLFEIWFNHDSNILLKNNLPYEIITNVFFVEYIKKSKIPIEKLSEVDYFSDSPQLIQYVLEKDFSYIEKIKKDGPHEYDVQIILINIFIKDIPNNLKHLSKMSELVLEGYMHPQTRQMIKQELIQNPIFLDDCFWEFLRENAKVNYLCIMKNPNILNLGWNGLDSRYKDGFDSLSPKEQEQIISLITEKKVTIERISDDIYFTPKLLDVVLKVNPMLVESLSSTGIYKQPKIDLDSLVDSLISLNYISNEKTPVYIFHNTRFMYYVLKNKQYIPEKKYIEHFITFENMYIFQDKELFIEYASYNLNENSVIYYEKLGVEKTIEAAIKYGELLEHLPIGFLTEKENITEFIHRTIKEGYIKNVHLVEAIIRSEYPITEKELEFMIVLTKNEKDRFFQYVIKINPKYIKYYDGNNNDIYDLAFELGYVLTQQDYDESDCFRKNVYISKMAFDLNPQNAYSYYGESEEFYRYIVNEKGFFPKTEKDFIQSERLCQSDIIFEMIISNKPTGFESLLKYYGGKNKEIILEIYKHTLKEMYNYVMLDSECVENYISSWTLEYDRGTFAEKTKTRELILNYMNPENVKAFKKMKIDYYRILKYGLNNEKMPEYIKIIKDNKLNIFVKLYNKITQEQFLNNNAFGIDLFLKLARFLNNYPELSEAIIKNKLTDSHKVTLTKLINSKQVLISVKTMDELTTHEENLRNQIENALNQPIPLPPPAIKDLILRYVFDLNTDEFQHILEKYINFYTLDKIIAKTNDKTSELYIEANILRMMMSMIEETVKATSDTQSLKTILEKFLDNSKEVDVIRQYFYDLKERIRSVYELDAIATLTDLDDKKLPTRVSKNNSSKNIIELENSEYVIYAHVMEGVNYNEYVNHRFGGRVTICVSPISNLGKKVYAKEGVILGFTKLSRGGFVGSSNRNMGSNSFVSYNNYEIQQDEYYHLEIKDSSALTPWSHPETLLYRDELIPTCIIIRGEEPTSQELEAQEKISQAIREEFGYDKDFEIPLVHTQEIGNVADITKNDDELEVKTEETILAEKGSPTTENQNSLGRYYELRNKIINIGESIADIEIEKNPVYDIIKMEIGGSHDMFQCRLAGIEGVFYLKPGYRKDGSQIDPYRAYAMKASYEIQKIVNPEHAVHVELVNVPLYELGKFQPENILCSAIRVIEESTSISKESKTNRLKEKEMKVFICEFITDYLLFSYDTKAENFVRDERGKVYGIDKEQALKFVLSEPFIRRDEKGNIEVFNTSMSESIEFDPNCCDIIYKDIFQNVAKGIQPLTISTLKKAEEAIARVESISDEEYIKIFQNYVDDFSTSSVMEQTRNVYISNGYSPEEALNQVKYDLYASLLSRKHNLRKEFNLYFTELITKHYQSRGEELPEWIKTQQLSI